MKTKFWIAAAAIIALLLAGCFLSTSPGESGERGSILFMLDNIGAKSLLPPISMEVTEYLVSGIGPRGATFGPQVLTGSTVIEDFIPGDWTFTVVGRNEAHNAIGEGAGTCEVVIGQTVTCTMTVTEYDSPDGSFLLDLAWEPDIVDFPVWSGSLKDSADVTNDMSFTVDDIACTAQSLNDPMHVGWFTMIVQLFDAPEGLNGTEVLSTGAAAAVRIASGRQTHGDLFLHAVQGYGKIDFQLDLNFNDELMLTPSQPFGDVTCYNNQVLDISVTADETCTSVYYLRGEQVGVDSYSLTTNDLFENEAYRLDVVSFNVDGTRAGSGTWDITRLPIDADTMNIMGSLQFASSPPQIYTIYLLDESLVTLDTISGTNDVGQYTYFDFGVRAEGAYFLKGWHDQDGDGTINANDRIGFYGTNSSTPPPAANVILPHESDLTYDFYAQELQP